MPRIPSPPSPLPPLRRVALAALYPLRLWAWETGGEGPRECGGRT